LSAAANVGSSRFTAGVPDFDLDLLVDFPKDPVSAIGLRDRGASGLSALLKSEKSSMIEDTHTRIACRKAFVLHHCLHKARPPARREWGRGALLEWNLNLAVRNALVVVSNKSEYTAYSRCSVLFQCCPIFSASQFFPN